MIQRDEPCRYLEEVDGRLYCAFFDSPLHSYEANKCFDGGWECYESPGGIVYNGAWLDLRDFLDAIHKKIPDNLETHLPDAYSGDVVTELLGWDEPA